MRKGKQVARGFLYERAAQCVVGLFVRLNEHFLDANIGGLYYFFMAWWWPMRSFRAHYVTEGHFDQRLDDLAVRLKKQFVTKNEFHARMDEVVTILKRLDQERVFTMEWIRRIETDVSMVKKRLKLA